MVAFREMSSLPPDGRPHGLPMHPGPQWPSGSNTAGANGARGPDRQRNNHYGPPTHKTGQHEVVGDVQRPNYADTQIPLDQNSHPGPESPDGWLEIEGEPTDRAVGDLVGHVPQKEEGNDPAIRNGIEWGVVLVAAILLALTLRGFVVQAFHIPSASMESTLVERDHVLVNRFGYRLHDVRRGDVVVFRKTDLDVTGPEQPNHFIKRVVALSGETIEFRDNVLFINGDAWEEPYLDEGVITEPYGPFAVPEGHFFAMGDNRDNSRDSRFELGPVEEDRIVGRAFVLFWPFGRFGTL